MENNVIIETVCPKCTHHEDINFRPQDIPSYGFYKTCQMCNHTYLHSTSKSNLDSSSTSINTPKSDIPTSRMKDIVTHPVTTHTGAYVAGILTKMLWDKLTESSSAPAPDSQPSDDYDTDTITCELVQDLVQDSMIPRDHIELYNRFFPHFLPAPNLWTVINTLQSNKNDLSGLTFILCKHFKLSGVYHEWNGDGSIWITKEFKDGNVTLYDKK